MGVRNTLKKAATGEADQERCVILGHYIVENNATVRAAAKKFGVSKSTVDRHLHDEVKAVLEKNKQERHLRGGQATRRKYAELSRRKMSQKTK